MADQKFNPPTEVDLEATAELPAFDFTGTATDLASTDVHMVPGIPAGVAELAGSLREAEQRLARKMERVAGLEGDLANALRSAVELRAQLDHEGAQTTRRENVLREAEQQLKLKSERVTGLEAELANAQRTAVELRAQLDLETSAGVRHEKALRETEQTLALRTARVTALETELASERRAVAEQRALLDQERLQAAQRERELRERGLAFEQQLAELRRDLAAREATQRQQAEDLLDLRRRNERSLEALHTWQGFRGVTVTQLDEQDVQLAQAQAQHAAQLADAETRIARQQAEAEARVAKLTAEAESRASQLQAELAAARAAAENRATALLAEAEARVAKLTTDAEARNTRQQTEAETRVAKLTAETESRASQLQAELAAARTAADSRAAALEESLRAALAANEAVSATLQAQQLQTQSLKEQLGVATAKAERMEHDLHVAEEHINRLESEAHASAALLGNLQVNVERLARDDTGSRPVLRVVPTTEPAQRVLIRQVDGVDVEYPLGRRTTIGRTPDNDIQVDTTFISRHHAVLLSNPDQCVVEDLNSTNGIMINGRPVNRQALRDGDTLTIGKSEFRYQQRA